MPKVKTSTIVPYFQTWYLGFLWNRAEEIFLHFTLSFYIFIFDF